MAEIQENASHRRDLDLVSLGDGIKEAVDSREVRLFTESLHEANQTFDSLRDRLPEQGPVDISFEDLARVPGAARSWRSPKRWVAAFWRLIFWRQERFNVEVVRRFAELKQDLQMQLSLDARLLGTFNSLAARMTRNDRALLELLAEFRDAQKQIDLNFQTIRSKLEKVENAERQHAPASASAAGNGHGAPPGSDNEIFEQMHGEIQSCAAEIARHARALNLRLQKIESDQAQVDNTVADLRQAFSKIEIRTDKPQPVLPPEHHLPVSEKQLPGDIAIPQFDFLVFESLTRGNEEAISLEQQKYISWFEGAVNVLDAGCGRGEFLELLRRAGIDAYGIDSDPQMVAHCQRKGLRVEQDHLFNHLKQVEDATLGGIFLGQVVEHLPLDALSALPALAMQKLKPGAAIIMETINPTCLTTFSGAFYADPTHYKPVHPKALEYFLLKCGFEQISVIFSAPVPENERLQPIHEKAPLNPNVKDVVLQVNSNFDRLNSVLYSYGNYAIAARKPANV